MSHLRKHCRNHQQLVPRGKAKLCEDKRVRLHDEFLIHSMGAMVGTQERQPVPVAVEDSTKAKSPDLRAKKLYVRLLLLIRVRSWTRRRYRMLRANRRPQKRIMRRSVKHASSRHSSNRKTSSKRRERLRRQPNYFTRLELSVPSRRRTSSR